MNKVKIIIAIFSFSVFSIFLNGQRVINPKFEKRLEVLLDSQTPSISVKDAHAECENYIFLDAREYEEYATSHIPNALYIGYDHFSFSNLGELSKKEKAIVYCSVGYRSEKITEKLRAAGYSEVYNLYGSIFEWVNHGFPVEDEDGKSTKTVHTYNKKWSQWIDNPDIIKKW